MEASFDDWGGGRGEFNDGVADVCEGEEEVSFQCRLLKAGLRECNVRVYEGRLKIQGCFLYFIQNLTSLVTMIVQGRQKKYILTKEVHLEETLNKRRTSVICSKK